MTKLRVNIFKPSGKWYTDEDIEIPDDIKFHNIPEYIKLNARIRNMTYLFYDHECDIPHLIHVGD